MKINSSGQSKVNVGGQWVKTAQFGGGSPTPELTQETGFSSPPAPTEGYDEIRQFLQQLQSAGQSFETLFDLWRVVWEKHPHLTAQDMTALQPILKESGLAGEGMIPSSDPSTFQGPM